jgi:hypothetical protein
LLKVIIEHCARKSWAMALVLTTGLTATVLPAQCSPHAPPYLANSYAPPTTVRPPQPSHSHPQDGHSALTLREDNRGLWLGDLLTCLPEFSKRNCSARSSRRCSQARRHPHSTPTACSAITGSSPFSEVPSSIRWGHSSTEYRQR